MKQDRQCTHKAMPRRVRVTVVTEGKAINITYYNKGMQIPSKHNLECCWLLVSKKHLKIRTFFNINITTYLTLVYNLSLQKVI